MAQEISDLMFEWADKAMRRSMRKMFEYNQAHGYSFIVVNSLRVISKEKEVTNNDLSRRLGVSMPAASQLVDRLVEMGLVEREDNPADRRSKYLTLTAQGRQTLDDMDKATHSWIPTLVSMLSEEEIKIIKPSLRLIVSKINQL